MNKSEVNKKIVKVLNKMGYMPEIDEDQDVRLMYQMKTLFVLVRTSEEDVPPMVCITMGKIYEVEESDKNEKTGALIVCNELTREKSLTKVTVDLKYGFVNAICQFLYTGEKALEQFFDCAFSSDELGNVSSEFQRRMNSLSE